MAENPRRLRVEFLESRRLLTASTNNSGATICSLCQQPETSASTAAVIANNLDGLRAAELQFTYESSEVEVDSQRIKPGTAWQGRASIVSRIDESAGTIDVFIYSANAIPISNGEIVEFDFDVVDELAHEINTARIELTKFELNEGQIVSPLHIVLELGDENRQLRNNANDNTLAPQAEMAATVAEIGAHATAYPRLAILPTHSTMHSSQVTHTSGYQPATPTMSCQFPQDDLLESWAAKQRRQQNYPQP